MWNNQKPKKLFLSDEFDHGGSANNNCIMERLSGRSILALLESSVKQKSPNLCQI